MSKTYKDNPGKYRKHSDNKPRHNKHKTVPNYPWGNGGDHGAMQEMYEKPTDDRFETPPRDCHD